MLLTAAVVLRLLAIFSVVELLFSMINSLTHNQTPSLDMRSDQERLIDHIATARGILVAPIV
jgi:hypothetical protein